MSASRNYNLGTKTYGIDTKHCLIPAVIYRTATNCLVPEKPCKKNLSIVDLPLTRRRECFRRNTRADRL